MKDDVFSLIAKEEKRQFENLELIPSENYVSKAVREALGSVLTNKYSEGYPGKRYYGGNQIIDEIEELARARACDLFDAAAANVQPYSGSPANHAVYMALAAPGETVMGMSLTSGGHLTHGLAVNFSGHYYNAVGYEVDQKTGLIDYDQVRSLAQKHKPKIIWAGATAYPRIIDFEKFAAITSEIGAYFACDMAHFAGLVAGGVHPSPFPFADVVTTTTHKTLRGPRGAIIFTTKKGAEKDPELAKKIDKAIFPGLQGGPHNHQTAAIAVALKEASEPGFKTYAKNVVDNAKTLAQSLKDEGLTLVSGGTDTHLMLINLSAGGISGKDAQEALDEAAITLNKNTVPGETRSPFVASGLRLGTPAITTRGMTTAEMSAIARWIKQVVDDPTDEDLKKKVRGEVITLTKKFPVP